jgi:hypothetical protein
MLALPECLCIWLSLWHFTIQIFFHMSLFLQAMIIIAWSNLGLVGVLTDSDVFRNVSSIFITYAILNFLQGKIATALFCWKLKVLVALFLM